MKHILVLLLFFGLAVPVTGCTLMKQSSQTHNAVQNQICDVHKVFVKKANGIKTVTVVVLEDVDKEQKDEINDLVKKTVPDVNEVEIKIYKGKK